MSGASRTTRTGRARGSPGASGRRDDAAEAPTSLRFVTVARALAAEARREGLVCPAFRSPPGVVGLTRTIRRGPDGRMTVAVALRSRPWAAVLADMVEGVVAANRLQGVEADRTRSHLWATLGDAAEEAA